MNTAQSEPHRRSGIKIALQRYTVCLCMILVTVTAAHARPFEGTVDISATRNGITSRATMYVKGNMIRIDPRGGDPSKARYSIINAATQKLLVISAGEKTYMEITIPKRPDAGNHTGLRLEKKGSGGVVAGVDCEEWIISEQDRRVHIWVQNRHLPPLKNIPLAQNIREADAKFIYRAVAMVIKEGYCPCKIKANLERLDFYFEISTLQEKTIDGALFSIPAGYRKKSDAARTKNAGPVHRRSE